MSLRDKINENQKAVTIVAGAIALLAILWIGWSLFGGGGGVSVNPEDAKLFYTTDDGATYAPGPASERLDPNKVRAYVYTVDGGKTKFVGYIERWTAEGVKALNDYTAAVKADNKAEYQRLAPLVAKGREVKRPKVGTWVASDSPEAAKVTDVRGPHGEESPDEVSATEPAPLK